MFDLHFKMGWHLGEDEGAAEGPLVEQRRGPEGFRGQLRPRIWWRVCGVGEGWG